MSVSRAPYIVALSVMAASCGGSPAAPGGGVGGGDAVGHGATTPREAAHPAVLPDPGTFTHRIVAETFVRRGLSLQLRMTTNYMETIKMMVSVGLAWSALPKTMVDAQVQVLPVPGVQLARQLGYVVHGGRTLSRAAQAFIGLLQAEASSA